MTTRCPMKVGDLVKSLNGMNCQMMGMLIKRETDIFTQDMEWLVHWFEHPPNELTFEYSEDLEVISESR